MTNQSLMIANYLTHAFIDSQIERAHNYNTTLCVVKFELKFDPKESNRFKEVMSFMYAFLGHTPIIYEGGEHFLIFTHDIKLHNVVMMVKNMLMSVKIKYSVNIHNVGVTVMDSEDDKNSLMERLHTFFMKSKIAKNIDIYYGTKYFDYAHSGDFNNIKKVFNQESKMNLYGFYKEAPLKSKVEAIEIKDGILKLKANKEYMLFMKKQEFVYLEHQMIPDIIRAEITKMDFNTGEIELDNLKFLDNSPVHRKNVRVTPHRPIQTVVEHEDEFYMEGLIADLSKNSILLTTQLAKIEELQAKGLQTKSFEIRFHLEGAEGNSASLTVKAMVYKIFGNQIVFNIYPTPDAEADIVDYIEMCQNLLLLEVRGTFVS